MKNRLLLTTLCCLLLLAANAQKEGNIWHFGRGAALDFNAGTAAITTPSSMWTFEGSASIADADGNLLFYSNGGGRDPILSGQPSGKIWNRNHQVMYDMGNTEGGGFSSAQSSVIIPKPGEPNHYYLFTMEEVEFEVGGSVPAQPQGRGLSYFDVDMALDGGLGGVASYTGIVLAPSYEGLCAVRHANGSDYWIIVHNDTLGLAVFPVNTAGVGAPLFFNFPGGTYGVIKASPHGKWLSTGTVLLQFDAASGVISSPLLLAELVNNTEFSPNSKRLFVITADNEVEYYDLTSPDISGSRVSVASLQNSGFLNAQMQLAPDGKIYFVQASFVEDSTYLSTIVCPNTSPFLELKKLAFNNADDSDFFGLPNFDNAIFRRDVDPPLPVNLGNDQTLCNNQNLLLNAGIANAAYNWSTGAQTQTLSVNAPGVYAVTVTAPGCGIGVDSIVVDQVIVSVNAGEDLRICSGDPAPLAATGTGTLLWTPAELVSNPEIANPLFTGDSSATLFLTATQAGCTVQDTVTATVLALPIVSVSPADTTIDAGETIQLTGTGPGVVLWSPAAGLSCTNCASTQATPSETTTYIFSATNAEGCTSADSVVVTVTPPDCTTRLPNAFTPNGDSVNDRFQPIGTAIESYELTVFNRWGERVFQGNTAWDGRFEGEDAPSDVYVFLMQINVCDNIQAFSGDVTLIR